MAPSAREIVDSYLGPQTYQYWQRLSTDALRERARFDSLEKRLKLIDSDISLKAIDDLVFLERLSRDYNAGMELVKQGQLVSKTELVAVYEMYSLVVGLAEHDNDLIEQVLVSGVVQAIAGFPFKLIAYREQEYARALTILKRELVTAKSLATEVHWQMAFDAAMIAVSLLPGAGLSIKLLTAANSYVYDELLGPDKTPTADKIDNASDIAGPLLDTVESIKRVGERTVTFAKKAGGVVTVIGYTMHLDELRTAHGNVANLKKAIDSAKRATESLIRLIEKHKGDLRRLRSLMVQVKAKVRDRRLQTIATRRVFYDTCQQHGYSGNVPKRWTIAPQQIPTH